MKTRFAPLAFAIAAITAAGSILPAVGQPAEESADEPKYVADQVIIKFRPSATDGQLLEAVQRGGLRLERAIAMREKGHPGFTLARSRLAVPAVMQMLKNHPAVEYIQPNWIYQHQAVPADPFYASGQLWGMYGDATTPSNPYGSQAAEAWAAGYTGSESVCVGVIDEGIQTTHPDLAANIWTNPKEIAGNGSDDDGNGLVDDMNGWDFYNDDATVYDAGYDGHGTHVAGTIGAAANNNTGVVGVNWNVKIISAKFLGPDGGTTADAIDAINYLIALKQNDVNLVAINASWGGGGYDPALLAAITAAANQDILFVAAAGNGNWMGRAVNNDRTPFYPACYNTMSGAGYDSVISVTALASNGSKPTWANYGATTVDLGAPGAGIVSTYPVDAYATADGTSMATPHVTGSVALYASTHPNATAAEIKQAILDAAAATPTSSLSGRTVTGGRLNIGGELIVPPGPIDTPPSVSITTPLDGAVVAGPVTIQASASDDHGVSLVRFIVDGNIEEDVAAPYEVEWNTLGATEGPHTITVEAQDTSGQTTTDTVNVTVDNVNAPPVANAGPDVAVVIGQAAAFDGSASSDPDGAVVSYHWDFGDGSAGTGATASHAYVSAGSYTVTLTVTDNDGATGQDTSTVAVTEPPAEVTVFMDSFEVSEWNGLWTEDNQNDWFRSSQRATDGSRSAEVDGSASNAALTSTAINLQGRTNARITFDWLIESGLDSGEYLDFRVSTDGGTTWTQKAILRGNVDPEGAWHTVTVELNDITQLRLQFRGKISSSTEDANVDNVNVVAF